MYLMSKSLSVFISRKLLPDSRLRAYLESEGIEFNSQSLIEFSSVAFELPNTDWIFFYSQKGVEYFLQQMEDLTMISNYKVGIFGSRTAKYFFSKTSKEVDFIGNAIAKDVSVEFRSELKSESVCFICGEKSLRSVQKSWGNSAKSEEVIVYSQSIKSTETLKEYDIAVMTSPLNVRGFIDNSGQARHYIAIGRTTAGSLELSNATIDIAEDPSEDGLLASLKSYLAAH